MQDLTKPSASGASSINPFRDDIFSFQSPIPGTPQIHQEEMTHCVSAIEKMVAAFLGKGSSPAYGELISISSPLAGYGKSHLISRISKTMMNSVRTIELEFGPQFSWGELLESTLQKFESEVSENGTMLDEVGAYFLTNLIGTAVAQGIIEERECPVALTSLQSEYCEVVTGSGRPKLLAWLKKKNGAIKSTVKLSPLEFAGFSKEDVSFWADYFQAYFRGEETVLISSSDLDARDRFLQLLRIASNCHPLLIIADHLDRCYGSETAGMEIATAVTSIVEKISNCVLLISINRDIWESIFENRLPSALLDRLNRDNLELAPVKIEEARELIVNRLCANGVAYQQSHLFANAVSEDCKWEDSEALFPRRIIRQANEIWGKRGSEFFVPTPEEKPEAEVEASSSFQDYIQPELEKGPMYTGSVDTAPNPFEGHSMTYSDRPGVTSPVPVPDDSSEFRNWDSEISQPPSNVSHQSDYIPAAAKDEPLVATPHPVNGKINGTNGSGTNGKAAAASRPAKDSKTSGQMKSYFEQLEAHFGKKADQLGIDFAGMEFLIKTVGETHPPLTQDEIVIPGGQSSCLRWDLKNYNVWIGFEPARNIYFYGNILQKLLNDPARTRGKIVCFAHESHPFSRELLTTNGITSEMLNRCFDVIQLSNAELVILHSASQFLKETSEKGYREEALEFILDKLNPLWQRLCQPISLTES